MKEIKTIVNIIQKNFEQDLRECIEQGYVIQHSNLAIGGGNVKTFYALLVK
ncbi:MAG: hypothetical protein FWC68_01100 [Oscillospiraceae bacterium]|nr:hypothetical protein [Oscillospiraceae bacterium]